MLMYLFIYIFLHCILQNDSNVGHTDTSSSIKSIEDINGVKIYLNELMTNINEITMIKIRHSFEQNINKKLNARELQDVLQPYNIILSDEDINPMFAKIDVKKEGTIDFLQFVTYLSFEFEIKRTRKDLNNEDKLMPRILLNEFNDNENNVQYKINGIVSKSIIQNSQVTKVNNVSEYVAFTATNDIVFYTSDCKWKSTYMLNDKEVMFPVPLFQYNIVFGKTIVFD